MKSDTNNKEGKEERYSGGSSEDRNEEGRVRQDTRKEGKDNGEDGSRMIRGR